MLHSVTGNKVYFVPDPSHVVKKLWNTLDNKNHMIYRDVTVDDGAGETQIHESQLFISNIYSLFLSLNLGGCPTTFRFHKNDFVKTSFEKMRVGSCLKTLGPKMISMVREGHRRENLYKGAIGADPSGESARAFAPWEGAYQNYRPFEEMCEHITALYNRLNSKRPPTFSAHPDRLELLAVFADAKRWFLDLREECFAQARRETFVEPGKSLSSAQLHKYFFTSEASEDFLSMLTVIPQLVKSY
ncbi:hypothetical protein B484DRAFT_405893 [Ochromonadaceae sp. CCMP2298]|nr:hypothetical protein B484DRAFT_405893 [Ochromonadaceae sp. CCMP2298]